MELVAREKALLAFHAENDAILEHLKPRPLPRAGAPPRLPATHPNISEAEAIFRVLSLASVAAATSTCRTSPARNPSKPSGCSGSGARCPRFSPKPAPII
ncbi:MAG: hypothetical protein ACLSHC_09385 [Bilophila wadsworthia]